MSVYALDTNVLIQAKEDHYGFDICPAFWEWLDIQNRDGKVLNIKKVRDELLRGDDELAEWAKERRGDFFINPDDDMVAAYRQVSEWANGENYKPNAVADFLKVADSWLVAYAHCKKWTVVTHEKSSRDSVKRIKIPDACKAFEVECINPFAMLRNEKAQFVLNHESEE